MNVLLISRLFLLRSVYTITNYYFMLIQTIVCLEMQNHVWYTDRMLERPRKQIQVYKYGSNKIMYEDEIRDVPKLEYLL